MVKANHVSDGAKTNVWTKYSRSFVRSVPRKNTRLASVLEVCPPLTPTSLCLDIGTGSGGFALFFAREGQWTFVEPNEEHIYAARKILKGTFVQTDGETYLRTESRRFNVITAIAMLYFISDLDDFFALARERMQPGGHFVVSGDDTAASRFFGPLRRALGIQASTGGSHDIGYEKVRKSLEASGFIVRRESRSTGLATMIFQTALDGLLVAFSGTRAKSKEDQLTSPMTERSGRRGPKRLARFPLRLATEFCKLLDRAIWFLPRYDFVICATPEDG